MLVLSVQVPEARDRTAVATLRDGFRIVSTAPAVASATPAIAAQRANPNCDPLRNWGHAPFGTYRLLTHVKAKPDLAAEYGSHLLLFEPESGQALEAESFGRLALLAYGGPAGGDGRMRRTQGGLRLGSKMLRAVVERLRSGADLTLRLEPLRAPSWWQFWLRPGRTHPLSGNLLDPLPPPSDEVSVLAELLQHSSKRRPLPTRDEWDDRRDRDDRSDRSSSGSQPEPVRGKGGEFAGGGASGGWDSAPGKGPGVDQAGRIVGGVAAAAALAAIAGGVTGAQPQHGSDGTGEGSTGTGEDSTSAGSGSGSDAPEATTFTAY